MTGQPQQYIITEEGVQKIREYLVDEQDTDELRFAAFAVLDNLHPYQSEREKVLKNIMELVDARIEGLDDLLATPAEQRTESAQDKYLKEARFELCLVQDEYAELRRQGEQE